VVDTRLDGEVMLLHLDTKTYYSLNPTGERIWQGLKQGLSLREISQNLQREFDVDAERADSGVVALIDELSRQELVQARS
jgi:hypothetical protein